MQKLFIKVLEKKKFMGQSNLVRFILNLSWPITQPTQFATFTCQQIKDNRLSVEYELQFKWHPGETEADAST